MKLIKCLTQAFLAAVLLLVLILPNFSKATPKGNSPEPSGNWYIQNFNQTIDLNSDSTCIITEEIIANCPGCIDKHGIFRVLPTKSKTNDGTFRMPVELISITDFNDRPLKYKTIYNRLNSTVTWKIGDSNKTVTGINNYKIKYKVSNIINSKNPNFDEFYWDLNGDSWDLKINKFNTAINFPDGINEQNVNLSFYQGRRGSQQKTSATALWNGSSLNIALNPNDYLAPNEALTISATFPKGTFTPYQFSIMDFLGPISIWYLLPLVFLLVSIILWIFYGNDPNINAPIVPEFEIPNNFSPLEMALVYRDGSIKSEDLTAQIIDLAVKGRVGIEKVNGFLGIGDDYKINLKNTNNLSMIEKRVLENLFGLIVVTQKNSNLPDLEQERSILLSQRKDFSIRIKGLEKILSNLLEEKKLIHGHSKIFSKAYRSIAIFFIAAMFYFFTTIEIIPVIITVIIALIFTNLIRRRTKEGMELYRRILGFRLYMNTAERYRQQFNEKENIFEKYLPYAILFGITREWAKKMEAIYGKDFISNYHPVWLSGVNISTFNISSFESSLNAISTSVGAASGMSSSGFGGGGGAGGGGGGGGGGGW